MEFGTWYQINCGTEREWHDDFAQIRDSGFDFVVLWNLVPPRGSEPADVRPIVRQSERTLRALEEVGDAGLAGYLGIWHPQCMGKVAVSRMPRWADGKIMRGPNVFNRDWLRGEWVPYVKEAAKLCAGCGAAAGVYLDDTFPALPRKTKSYLSYSAPDKARFRQWLKRRYLSIDNFNARHKLARMRTRRGYRSFESIDPPRRAEEALTLWTDWTRARADWCEEFARSTVDAYRSVGPDSGRQVVLSDQDYHMDCTPMQYGVDYGRLMRHFDRFEIYMAVDHRSVGRREVLADVRQDVRCGLRIAGDKPFQFHTWFTDPVEYRSMSPSLLEAVVRTAAEEGAATIEVYTFKVRDWRVSHAGKRVTDELPVFKEVSLKHNPRMLRRLAEVMAGLR